MQKLFLLLTDWEHCIHESGKEMCFILEHYNTASLI